MKLVDLSISRKLSLLLGVVGILFLGLFARQLVGLNAIIHDDREMLVRAQVESAMSIVDRYVAAAEAGTLTEEEAKAQAVDVLTSISYGSGDYVFAYTTEGVLTAHPSQDLVGQNVWDRTDPDGVPLFQEMAARAQEGGGTVPYLWPRAGAEDPVAKISYAELVPEWDWVVASGVYVDDLIAQTAGEMVAAAVWLFVFGVILLGCGIAIVRSITRPLAALTASVAQLRSGDPDLEVPAAQRDDEMGQLAREIVVLRDMMVEKARSEAEETRRREAADAERLRAEEKEREARKAADAERARNEAEQERARLAAEKAAEDAREAAAVQAKVVAELGRGLQSLAEGDLSQPLEVPFSAEYEELRANYNAALTALKDVVQTIAGTADGIRSGSGELSQASDNLCRRTEQQAAALEQTAETLRGIATVGERTAQGAEKARERVGLAKDEADRSGDEVQNTVSAMKELKDMSGRVGQITQAIEDIAFQTNILALNASVEAARAGAAGRGFAVVADEVGVLARRTSSSAKEIAELIGQSTGQVDQCAQLVDSVGGSLHGIINKIAEVNEVVLEISQASEEQASGLRDVNTAMGSLDSTTQQNAAMAEETNTVAATLRQSTEELSALMGRFRLTAQVRRHDVAA